jgi:hypothetical protein
MDMELSLSTDIVALSVNIVNFKIGFTRFRSFSIINYEFVSFFLHKTIKMSEFWYGIEEYDNLWFALKFANFLQYTENDLILFWTFAIEVVNSNQSFIFIFRIKFYKIVTSQVILNKLSEVIFISCCWSDKKLNYGLLTFAVEVFTAGFASSLSMLLNYPRVSSLTLSH